jgi:hypothetical protein
MQRYFFHFVWPGDVLRDIEGAELEGFDAAYHYAWGLVQQVHSRFPHANVDWWIDIDDGSNKPVAILIGGLGGRIVKLRQAMSS